MNKEAMMELLKRKKAEGKELSEPEKKAKMVVLGDIHSMAKEMMGDGLKGLKKVTVASPSHEGLEAGLDKARELVKNTPMAPESESALGREEGSEEGEPDEGSAEEEEGESPEEEAAEGPEGEKAEESCGCGEPGCPKCGSMSPEEIDSKIEKLMELKRSKEHTSY